MNDLDTSVEKLLTCAGLRDFCKLPTNRPLVEGVVSVYEDVQPDFYTENEAFDIDRPPGELQLDDKVEMTAGMLEDLYVTRLFPDTYTARFIATLNHYGVPDLTDEAERGDLLLTVIDVIAKSVSLEVRAVPIAAEDRAACAEVFSHSQEQLAKRMAEVQKILVDAEEESRTKSEGNRGETKTRTFKRAKSQRPANQETDSQGSVVC
jgi:hypothetical protein